MKDKLRLHFCPQVLEVQTLRSSAMFNRSLTQTQALFPPAADAMTSRNVDKVCVEGDGCEHI